MTAKMFLLYCLATSIGTIIGRWLADRMFERRNRKPHLKP